MVVESRNVTFDLASHMEQEFMLVNEKGAKDAFVLEDGRRTNEKKMCNCLSAIYHFNTIYLFR